MTAKELIDNLSKIDPEREVVIQCGPGQNRFAPCKLFSVGAWNEASRRFGLDTLIEASRAYGYSELDTVDGKKVVALISAY